VRCGLWKLTTDRTHREWAAGSQPAAHSPGPEGTFRVHDSTRWAQHLTVTAGCGHGIPHADAATLRLAANRTSLTQALSDALHREDTTPDHDRGRVVVDTAVMMAGAGNTMRAIDTLRHTRDLLAALVCMMICVTLAHPGRMARGGAARDVEAEGASGQVSASMKGDRCLSAQPQCWDHLPRDQE
jgi:hypothetical protein